MANLKYTTDLKTDVLFRAGEPTDGRSDYNDHVLELLNRAQNALALGGCEFAPEINEDWWWLRKDPPGTLVLQAPIETGTVTVTNNSNIVTFSDAPAASVAGWFFKTTTDSDVFRVTSHVAAAAGATLDSVFTGTSGSKTYTVFKAEYPLASDVLRIIGPMRGYADGTFDVDGCEAQALNRDYPLARIEKGRPDRFAPVTETKVRFNRCGIDTEGALIRLEYDYLFRPATLTGDDNEEPAVPQQFRYLLADMALFWLYLVKDDNRDAKLSQIVGRGIEGMKRENQKRKVVYGGNFGRISARGTQGGKGVLRSESGFILG